jgi:hypothetical protein
VCGWLRLDLRTWTVTGFPRRWPRIYARCHMFEWICDAGAAIEAAVLPLMPTGKALTRMIICAAWFLLPITLARAML